MTYCLEKNHDWQLIQTYRDLPEISWLCIIQFKCSKCNKWYEIFYHPLDERDFLL